MEIKNYSDIYLEEIIKLWNEEFPLDSIEKEDFIKTHLNDPNFDNRLFLIALDNQKVIGFLFGIKRLVPYFSKGLQEDKCWIKMVLVASNYQNRGHGTKLLNKFESLVNGNKTLEIILAMYSPNYLFAGIEECRTSAINFFEKNGYHFKENAYWMEKDLTNFIYPDSTKILKKIKEKENFNFFSYNNKYKEKLLLMIEENFSDGWYNYVNEAIKNNTAQETIIVAIKQQEVVGYISRASIDGNPSRIGPFGVASNYRSYKLGEILLAEMFQSMKDNNIFNAFFKSTEENGKRFYERNQMKVARVFLKYSKTIKGMEKMYDNN